MWPWPEQATGTCTPPEGRELKYSRSPTVWKSGEALSALDCLVCWLSPPLPMCAFANRLVNLVVNGQSPVPQWASSTTSAAASLVQHLETLWIHGEALGNLRTRTALPVASPPDRTPLAGLPNVGDVAVFHAGTESSGLCKLAPGASPPPLLQACGQSGLNTHVTAHCELGSNIMAMRVPSRKINFVVGSAL